MQMIITRLKYVKFSCNWTGLTSNAALISFAGGGTFNNLGATNLQNSSNSIPPLLSTSASFKMDVTSISLKSPSLLRASLNSPLSILPFLFLSKKSNVALHLCF